MKVNSYLFIILLLSAAISCAGSPVGTTAPSLQNAEWDFYWNQVIDPSRFMDNTAPDPPGRIKPPSLWTDPGPDQTRNPSFGYATYHIEIPATPGKTAGIYVRDVFSAYNLYADDQLVLSNGVFGMDEKTHEPAFVTRTAYFTPKTDILHVTVHVSNFTNRDAGIAWIVSGTEGDIARMRGFSLAFDAFLIGGLFIFAIYHLVLFLLRRREWNILYFSLLCTVVAFRVALMGERLASHLFSGINQDLLLQIEFLTVPLITIFFSSFFYRQYKINWYRFFHYPGIISSALFAVSIFALPISVSSWVLSVYHLLAAVLGLGFITALIYAVIRKMEGAVFFLAGFLIFFTAVINDILLYNRIINGFYMIPMGIFLFLFSQAFILSFSFTRAFKSVDTLSRKLITLDKLKDAFLANTTNELVSPISTMIGSAESILEGQAGRVNEEQARKLSFIVSSGRRLSNLVHDIMDFSQIKHKELVLDKKPVDMHQICQTVFLFSRPLLRDREIELVNKIPESFPPVFGDGRRIQQIMNNLIDNAIKFTDAGTITVSAFKMQNQGFFAVGDTGRGIPDEKLDIIFESFGQVNPKVDTQMGGKGLGLPITKYLVELHGGEITVNSAVHRGSTFTFSLPLASGEDAGFPAQPDEEELMEGVPEQTPLSREEKRPARVRPEAPASKIRILLACDDARERKHIRGLLESSLAAGTNISSRRETFVISEAESAEEALAQASAGEFDLALVNLEWAKDENAGFELCSNMRRKKTRQELPVIIMAKHRTDANLARGIESGASDFMEKPLIQSELVMRVKTHSDIAKLHAAYSRFVPERFLELLGKESIADVSAGDQIQKEMTILFCDIRAFMSFSEKMTPKETFTFLNSYYEKITPIIRQNRGFIDKFIGDEVMALFPEDGEDALKAALEIKKSIDIYNMFRAKTGYQPVTIGIGIHSGPMMLGTIGDNRRLDGTVISDAVNTASRLEGLTKLYGGSIVISASIFYALQDPSQYFYRFLGLVQVKGKRSTVPIYEIYDDSEEGKKKQATKDDFEKALQLYFRKDFKEAGNLFKHILEINSADKAARLFANRCEEYKHRVIDSDWDGVETVFTK